MMLICILFTLGIYSEISGLIMPMTKQDGSVDMSSVLSHITLLAQTVSDFHIKTDKLESEIQTSKTDLQVTKSELQSTKSELQSTKSELQSTKSELQSVKADLKDQQRHCDVEIASLKDELASVKTELVMTSDEVISVKSQVATLKSGFLSPQASINQTLLDSINQDVKTNMADIKSVKDALEMTNSTLAQIQSKISSSARDVTRVNHNVMSVQSQLASTISDINLIKSEVTGIKRNVSGLEATSTSVTHIPQMLPLKTQTVAFSARLASEFRSISNHPVRFDAVDYNSGSGYSGSTGRFTAPVSGTYLFSAQIEMVHANNQQQAYIHIEKSGSVIAAGYGETSQSIDDITIPVTTVTYVRKGEKVSIQSSSNVEIFGGHSSQFVGVLVSVS